MILSASLTSLRGLILRINMMGHLIPTVIIIVFGAAIITEMDPKEGGVLVSNELYN